MKITRNGIYQNFTTRVIGDNRLDILSGIIKGKSIKVYTSYEKGKIDGKLYYLENKGSWIHYKLIQYKDGVAVRKLDKSRLDVMG